jgi:bifunctional ADP-heptose synthase (sugar kinase/adenylyltransferase)
MSEQTDSSDGTLRDVAAAIYKLGAVAAVLGLTGQESADELVAAARKLKAQANSARNAQLQAQKTKPEPHV